MKNDERIDDLPVEGLRALRTAVPVEDPARVAARRGALVRAIAREIAEVPERQRRQRLRRQRTGALALVAGIALLVASGTVLRSRGSLFGSNDDRASTAQGPSTGPSTAAGEAARLLQGTGSEVVPNGMPRATSQAAIELRAGTMLPAGTVLRTNGAGWLEMELPDLSRVELGERSELTLATVERSDEQMILRRGRVDVSVPKPHAGVTHHLVVRTPDSEVEVRGTVFSVEVVPDPAQPSRLITEVFVSRGAVAVHHDGREYMVTMGGHFRSNAPLSNTGASDAGTASGRAASELAAERDEAAAPHAESGHPADACAESTSPTSTKPKPGAATLSAGLASTGRSTGPSTTQGATTRSGNSPSDAPQASAPQASAPQASRESTLGEQNRLFEQALAARDRGELERAVALFDQLLTRYPTSPLGSSVRTERARAVARLGNGEQH